MTSAASCRAVLGYEWTGGGTERTVRCELPSGHEGPHERHEQPAAQGHVPFVGGIPQGLGEPETPSAACACDEVGLLPMQEAPCDGTRQDGRCDHARSELGLDRHDRPLVPPVSDKAATWRERRRAKRLLKAELRLADAEQHLRRFGFANTPSEDYAEEQRILKLRRKVEALGGE